MRSNKMTGKSKRTTIFRQLIINIVIPVLIALVVLAIINYIHSKSNLEEWNQTRNEIISDEISYVHEFQDFALEILEENLDKRLSLLSDSLVNYLFKSTDAIEVADLDMIQKELKMNPEMEDIYIIDKEGVVVNTTFKKDKGLNLFNFGEDHKNYLLEIFANNKFVSERIAIESSTKRLKKYSYQPTIDNKYIIELGVYSERVDHLADFIRDRFKQMPNKQESLMDVDIFVGSEKPFSFSKKETNIVHPEIVQKVFETGKSESIIERNDDREIRYSYIYMQRKNSDLYKNAVIVITSDRTGEMLILKMELFKLLAMFGGTILIIILLIFFRTRLLVKPIKMLLRNVNRITDGHLDERAEVVGKNEITELTEKFNVMIGELESYTNELEEKVKERTEEVVRQKEEIQQKNKQITDSIFYAKRIQTAILPEEDTFNETFADHFVFFKPKDIVSGDFYFLQKVNDVVLFAAADCTGHGVPGALMSMMGTAFLNEIVRRKEVSKASEVLNILREEIKHSLKQTGRRGENREGMDISFCVINTKTKELQYAGAYNPLILIRDDELTEYKADRMPIGFHRKEKESFTNHALQVKSGDRLYLYSDGFYDQLGGTDRQKYMNSNFKDLLKEISTYSMAEQKDRIEKAFEEWKGDNKQIDDIIVLGIKV